MIRSAERLTTPAERQIRRMDMKVLALFLALLFLSACGPKEVAVTPTPPPTPTQQIQRPAPDPVCILEGEDIVSLCGNVPAYSAMVTADGRLLAWGDFPFDRGKCVQLWDSDVYELPLQNITGAWLGYDAMLALDKDGTLWGLGSNASGQLWDAPKNEGFVTPVKVTDHVVSATIEGGSCSAALKDDGSVWLAGSGTDTNGEEISLPPTKIATVKGATELYAGYNLWVRDRDGVSRRIGDIDELLNDPTALDEWEIEEKGRLVCDAYGKYVLTDDGDLYKFNPPGDPNVLLNDVAEVALELSMGCGHYSTVVTKDGEFYQDGDLYLVWMIPTEKEGWVFVEGPAKVMEGVKLARPCGSGVVVVAKSDGGVWDISADTLNAALDSGTLITLPEGR